MKLSTSLALYQERKQKYQNGNIHLKIRVPMSMILVYQVYSTMVEVYTHVVHSCSTKFSTHTSNTKHSSNRQSRANARPAFNWIYTAGYSCLYTVGSMYSEGTFLTFFSRAFPLKIGAQRRDGRRHGTGVRNLAPNRGRFMNFKRRSRFYSTQQI